MPKPRPAARRRTGGKPGPKNQVEVHPQRAQIDLALANGVSIRRVAERFSLNRECLRRYKLAMTPEREAMLKYRAGESLIDLHRLKDSEAEAVIQRNIVMMQHLWRIFEIAADNGDTQYALQAAAQYRRYNELTAKLVGEIYTGERHLHMHVTDSPAYRRLVAVVMAWASNKPELLAELSETLQTNEEAERALIEAPVENDAQVDPEPS